MHEEKLGKVILLGRKDVIIELKEEIGFSDEVTIIDPKTDEEKERINRFGEAYWKTRQRKGRTLSEAKKINARA